MRYTGVRSGTFATYRGLHVRSRPIRSDGTVLIISDAPENPDSSLFAWNGGWEAWTARVDAADCERIYTVHTYARYQGHRVLLNAVDEHGMASIEYADWNGAWATENGFETVDKYQHVKNVPAGELADVYEKQNDDLFRSWRAATFPAPAAAGGREAR